MPNTDQTNTTQPQAPAQPTGCCAPFLMKFKTCSDVNQDGKLDAKDVEQAVINLSTTAKDVASHLKMEAAKAELFVQAMLANVNKLILILQAIEPFIKAADPQGDQIVLDAIKYLQMLAPVNNAAVAIATSATSITTPTDIASFNKTLSDAQQTTSVVEANLRLLKQAGLPGTDAALDGLTKVDAVLAKAKEVQEAVANAEKQATLVTAFNTTAASIAEAPKTPAVAPAPALV